MNLLLEFFSKGVAKLTEKSLNIYPFIVYKFEIIKSVSLIKELKVIYINLFNIWQILYKKDKKCLFLCNISTYKLISIKL